VEANAMMVSTSMDSLVCVRKLALVKFPKRHTSLVLELLLPLLVQMLLLLLLTPRCLIFGTVLFVVTRLLQPVLLILLLIVCGVRDVNQDSWR
jgi:hypothetical protein